MDHPPLCPKTEGNWMHYAHTGAIDVIISDDTYLDDDLPDHRQFIARFQACAWHDRHARWSRIHNRIIWGYRYGTLERKHVSGTMARKCYEISQEWREWEKQK